MEMPKKIEITTATIIKIIAIVLGLWLAYYILDILVLIFVVILLAVALEPIVARLTGWGIPRVLSILIVFVVVIAVFGLAVYIVVPPLAMQMKELASNAPAYFDKITNFSASYSAKATQQILSSVSNSLGSITGGFFSATVALFGGFISIVTGVVLTFYLLLEERGIRKTLIDLTPARERTRVGEMSQHIGIKMGLWLRGQLMLMVIVGLMTTLAMQIIGMPFALALGVSAGLLEIIPIIGPIISGVFAVIIAMAAGVALWKIIVIIAIYIAIQQIESQLLVPKIMQKAMGISPIVVIIAILIGDRLLGLGGAILAIPIVGVLAVFTQEYLKTKKLDKTQ